jgi:tRNA (guanine-N7-)-methyltransferase
LRKIDSLSIKPTNLFIINDDAKNLLIWFKKHSISKIYLNFSDPWPKKRHEKYRLTSKYFLDIYHELLIGGKLVEFKTDNQGLYEYSLESLKSSKHFNITYKTENLYLDKNEILNNVQTEYEKKFIALNEPIYKITFQS